MKFLSITKCLMILGLFSFTFSSCSKDPYPPEDSGNTYEDNRPTQDVVSTKFNGKVALLNKNTDELINYLNKRFTNTSYSLTEDTDVVLLDEAKAQEILNDSALFASLKKLYRQKKAICFISPSTHQLTLWKKLQKIKESATVTIPQDEISQWEDIHIFITRIDGTSLFHEKVYISDRETEISAQNLFSKDSSSVITDNITVSYTPSDYDKGRVAENTASWLNKHALTGNQMDAAFTSSDETSYSVNPVVYTYIPSITVSYDHLLVKYGEEGCTIPTPVTVTPKVHMEVYGGFWETQGSDVYDVNIYEEFPADETYIENIVVYKKAAYKYKFTGGCYYGPIVDMSLKNTISGVDFSSASTVSLEQIAPLPQAGTTTTLHNPAQIGFGSSLQGSASTDGIGLSGGLSMSCTLPSTTMSFNHEEMPINFSYANQHAYWEYSTNYQIYRIPIGFNSDFIDVPDICHSFCHTDQAVTFIVKNSSEFRERDINMSLDVKFRIYSEYATPWGGWWGWDSYPIGIKSIILPKVNRYFEKYTPYPMPGFSGMGDSAEWGNLEERLMRNINYRALCDETLQVGAQIEENLDLTAEEIWRSAIEALVTQYNGTSTTNEYLIGLAREDGTHIKLGLHIKEGKWTLVENVDSF